MVQSIDADNGTAAKILIIDDEESLRSMLLNFLTDEGYATFGAENGVHGLKFCEKTKPDLVICDLLMPEKEGIETIATLRRLFGKSIKIIAISGGIKNVATNFLDVARHLGADDVLEKPFGLSDLKNKIISLLNE